MFQETAISRLSYGRVVVECMNKMDFDMMILGNHEFDWTLDKCLEYWDNDKSNGEATFPLLNANVIGPDNKLIEDAKRNILPSTIIEREGLKIGLIGLMGDVYNSILASMTKGYTFKSSLEQLKEVTFSEGKKLKDNGADIIIVAIHDGDSKSVLNYKPNRMFADLKYKNEYLIDAVINAHTHTEQDGMIKRADGVDLPVIQSRLFSSQTGNLNTFGRIDLTINMKKKKVVSAECSHVKVGEALTNYNEDVQNVVDSFYKESKDILEESYCNNEVSFKGQKAPKDWVCNLAMKKTGATACLVNNGGLRGTVKKGPIGFKDIYNYNPFDNKLVLMDIRGYDLKSFIDKNSDYYFYNTDTGYIDQNKTYKLAVIDYVFFSKYFSKYRPKEYEVTDVVLRDLMIEELRHYNGKSFNIFNVFNNIHI